MILKKRNYSDNEKQLAHWERSKNTAGGLANGQAKAEVE